MDKSMDPRNGKIMNVAGDERYQGIGAIIEQDQFCRPANIHHIIE